MINEEFRYMVAIECVTFQQSKYIKDALDGFCMQKTSFPFIAIVIDDASTDGEQDVINNYLAANFDEKEENLAWIKDAEEGVYFFARHKLNKNCFILSLNLKKNLYKTGKKMPLVKKWFEQAKYIALCEGDDYWTDPYKLQKQVDFLEEHEDYSMCCHAAEIVNETSAGKSITCDNIEEKEYFANDFFPGWVVPTASVVYRRDAVAACPPLVHKEWQLFGDIVLFLQCAQAGRTWGMKERMSVYRMTESGAVRTGQRDASKFEKLCRHYEFLMLNFPQLDKKWPNEYIATYYYTKFRKTKLFKGKTICLMTALSHSPKYVLGKFVDAFKR